MLKHEIINYNQNVPVKLSIQRIDNIEKHWHNSIEILFILSGKVSVTLEEKNYDLKEDDIILINPNQIHKTSSADGILALLQLRLSMLPNISKDCAFICNSVTSNDNKHFNNIKRILAELIILNANYQEKQASNLLNMSYAYMLVHELKMHFSVSSDMIISHNRDKLKRLNKITSYLEENYMNDISLNEISEKVHLSSSYLSHFFKKNMGINFSDYLTKIRLNNAVKDLISTENNIKDIALNNGFPNSRSFVTAFRRKYDILPSEYRQQHSRPISNDTILEDLEDKYLELKKYDYLNPLQKYLKNKNSILPSKKEAPVDTQVVSVSANKDTSSLAHNFRVFTSVGRAKDILKKDIQTMLRQIQNEIDFTYIKFHGILDDNMMLYNEDSSGDPYLTFTYIDKILDFLLEIGLKPLIQFSFMPEKLAANPEQTLFASPVIISPPSDINKWKYLITKFTEHLIDRYGKKEVEQWLFTYWNEALIPSPFSFGTSGDNLQLYKITYNSVKSINSNLKFGNPSFITLKFPDSLFNDFLDYTEENNCVPDFYNFHFYPTQKDIVEVLGDKDGPNIKQKPGKIMLSQDPEAFHDFVNSWSINKSKIPERPFYLTEWNSSFSQRDWLNDTCYRSAYLVKNICENYDKLDSFGVWTLTDALEEMPLNDRLFHGGIGFFTKNGIKKPAFYALKFLSQLDDNLLQQGNGYFITTDNHDNYSILLYNYHHFSSFYAQGILIDSSPETRYEVFGNPSSSGLSLQISDVKNGTYHIKEYLVNREHGSCYDEWVRMGGMPVNNKRDIKLLKQRSVPYLKQSKVGVKTEKITHYALLEPHEIRLVKISKAE